MSTNQIKKPLKQFLKHFPQSTKLDGESSGFTHEELNKAGLPTTSGNAREREFRLDKIYQALEKVRGIGPKGLTDTSTTINEILYGENGAWRPQEE
jgi:hypothetical protein